MSTLFASDVHLSAQRPAQARAFLRMLDELRSRSQALYLLGDIFDAWLGDDDERPLHADIATALSRLDEAGTSVYLMHGNHDFLIASDFAKRCSATLLPDPVVTELHGQRVLLSHGDIYCTDDAEYQEFRRLVREPTTQQAFLALPIDIREQQAAALQEKSRASTRAKPVDIMDVNTEAVADALREHATSMMVHGHTHRPAQHDLQVDGRSCRRYVLGDWYETDNARVLLWSSQGDPVLMTPSMVPNVLVTP